MCALKRSAFTVCILLVASGTPVPAQTGEATGTRIEVLHADCRQFVATALQIPASSVLVTTDHYNDILGDFCDDSYHGPHFDRFASSMGEEVKYSADTVEYFRELYCRDATGAFWEGYYQFLDSQNPKAVSLYKDCEGLGLYWSDDLRYGVRIELAAPPTREKLSLGFTLADQEDPSGPPTIIRIVNSNAVDCSWSPARGHENQAERRFPATDYALAALDQSVTLTCHRRDGGPSSSIVVVGYTEEGEVSGRALHVPWPR